MNKVILMGRLTRDPEVRYSQAAEPLAIAASREGKIPEMNRPQILFLVLHLANRGNLRRNI